MLHKLVTTDHDFWYRPLFHVVVAFRLKSEALWILESCSFLPQVRHQSNRPRLLGHTWLCKRGQQAWGLRWSCCSHVPCKDIFVVQNYISRPLQHFYLFLLFLTLKYVSFVFSQMFEQCRTQVLVLPMVVAQDNPKARLWWEGLHHCN